MKHFCIILTAEGRLRFRFLRKEHGLLHERNEKKTYAVVREPYPTNWLGKWARAYVIQESQAQTARIGDKDYTLDGGTVQIVEPLNMVAKIRMPGPRGEDGETRDVHLTAEAMYDRTLSVQVRRLGNRRIQWFHALLFVSLGIAICLALVAAITLANSGDTPPPSAPLVVTPGSQSTVPQSGPAPSGGSPTISIQRPAEPGPP